MPQRVAHGRLSFERAGDSTAVLAAYADSPLRLLTPKNHGDSAWVYLSTLGGGLVGGDRVRLDIDVAPNARALISTQGPTRIYRSNADCSSEVHARVGEGGALLLLPDHVSCFAGASFTQHTELALAGSASLAAWDLLSAGRAANGERWAFRGFRNSLRVRQGERVVVDDALLLDPAHGPIAERLGRFDALATLLLLGPLFATAAATLRARIDSGPLATGASMLAVASPLGSEGLLVRFAATSISALGLALRSELACVPALLGDDPWARRN